MGSTKTKQIGEASLASNEQTNFINQIVGQLTGQAGGAYGDMTQEYDPEQFQQMFQQAFVDPAMMNYSQQVVPGLQQQFNDANAGSSSALNQALASSAKDLSTGIGSQMGQFYQNYQSNKLGALGQMGGLAGTRILDPIIQEGYNSTGDWIGLAGSAMGAAGAAYASSKDYKENIEDVENMLDTVNALSVKKYDYREERGGRKGNIGLIAENVPEELKVSREDFKGVDVYGLASMLVKAVQELTQKVKTLEKSHANSR